MKKKRLYVFSSIFSMLFFLCPADVAAQVPVFFGYDVDADDDMLWLSDDSTLVAETPDMLALTDLSDSAGEASLSCSSDASISVLDVTMSVAPKTTLSANNFLQVSIESTLPYASNVLHRFSVRLLAVSRQPCVEVDYVYDDFRTLAKPRPVELYDEFELQNVRVRLVVSDVDGKSATLSVYLATSPMADFELFWRRRNVSGAADLSAVSLDCKYTKTNAADHFFFRDLSVSRQPVETSDYVFPLFGNVVVNEVLPLSSDGKSDFFELFNASADSVELASLLFLYSSNDVHFHEFALADDPAVIPPGGYVVIGRYPGNVKAAFGVSSVHGDKSVPLLAQDGHLVVQDFFGNVFDSVAFSSSFHSAVLADQHNVSLERLSPSADGCSPSSWASAAASAGYATPGGPNCRTVSYDGRDDAPRVSLASKVFIPNGGGLIAPDHAEVQFVASGDWTVTLRVFSPSGSLVATPADGVLSASSDVFVWNGRCASGALVSPGSYVLLFTAWCADGRTFRHRLVVTLGAL